MNIFTANMCRQNTNGIAWHLLLNPKSPFKSPYCVLQAIAARYNFIFIFFSRPISKK